jgi:hypothetical protein
MPLPRFFGAALFISGTIEEEEAEASARLEG